MQGRTKGWTWRAAAGGVALLLATVALTGIAARDAGSQVSTVTLTPVADSYVQDSTPGTNYGTDPRIVVDASPVRQIFLRFDLSAVSGTVQNATLRLHVSSKTDSESPSGGSIARVNDNTWTETGITYTNRPTSWAAPVATLGAVNRNTWIDIPVTPAVTSGGLVTLGVQSDDGDGAYYDSRQTPATAPQLVVTTESSSTSSSSSTSTSSSSTSTSSSSTSTSSSSTTTTSSSTTTTTTTTGTTPPGIVNVAAVGDMACTPGSAVTTTSCRQLAVSNLIVNDPTNQLFLALGDEQYENGALSGFQGSYDASYGRIRAKTMPTVGNHEYGTAGATGYFSYFGAAAGPPSKGYYSFDVGSTWHVVTLNSNCSIVSCAAGSTQEQWLRADLAANSRPCVIATWHTPRFSSDYSVTDDAPFWDDLQQYGVELNLVGHEHSYERFNPQLPNGTASANGVQEIVVGTGGRSLDGWGTPLPNSAIRLSTFGVLKLQLAASSYSWQFVDQTGAVRDSGTRPCH